MKSSRKNVEKNKAFNLLGTGLTQREIAQKLKVTEKTVGKWAKEWKQENQGLAQNLQLCNNRLQKLIKDPNAKTSDIKNLVGAIGVLKRLE